MKYFITVFCATAFASSTLFAEEYAETTKAEKNCHAKFGRSLSLDDLQNTDGLLNYVKNNCVLERKHNNFRKALAGGICQMFTDQDALPPQEQDLNGDDEHFDSVENYRNIKQVCYLAMLPHEEHAAAESEFNAVTKEASRYDEGDNSDDENVFTEEGRPAYKTLARQEGSRHLDTGRRLERQEGSRTLDTGVGS